MPSPVREYTCSCGQVFRKRGAKNATPSCQRCGIQRSVDNAQQLHAKQGPAFDRWAASMDKAATRMAAGVAAAVRFSQAVRVDED